MNKVHLQPTIFESRPQGTKAYGYIIRDDHGGTYSDILESIPSNMKLLIEAIDSEDDVTVAIIEHLLANQKGLYIGDEWYEWDRIKHLF